MKAHKILSLNEIKPYENNPRINDDAVDSVAESIEQCGYIAPIIIDENNVILAGHTRWKALKKLNYEKVDVIQMTDMTEEEKKKYRLLDNKTSEFAIWNFDALTEELKGLDFGELNLDWGIKKIPEDNYENKEIDISDFDDEHFDHECPKCGFKFNDGR